MRAALQSQEENVDLKEREDALERIGQKHQENFELQKKSSVAQLKTKKTTCLKTPRSWGLLRVVCVLGFTGRCLRKDARESRGGEKKKKEKISSSEVRALSRGAAWADGGRRD